MIADYWIPGERGLNDGITRSALKDPTNMYNSVPVLPFVIRIQLKVFRNLMPERCPMSEI